jgi:ketosteroid isomerase-like protein
MSQENVETVRQLFELQGDPRVFELIHPEVIWTNFSSAPEQQSFVGHAGVVKWLQGFVETLGGFEFVPDEIIDAGDRGVVSVSRATGQGVKSGVPVEIEVSTIFGFRDGKIVSGQGYETREAALEAAGLRK